MAQQSHIPGHYSGSNKVPTIDRFLQSLDSDKKERDRRIDEEAKQAQGDVRPHQTKRAAKEGTQKTVTDPTTGNQVVIEDASPEMIKAVENPMVPSLTVRRVALIAHAVAAHCPERELGQPYSRHAMHRTLGRY